LPKKSERGRDENCRESPFCLNALQYVCEPKKLLHHKIKKFKEKMLMQRVRRGDEEITTQQLNKRIMPNPAVN
jgi:hypothetical protein